jgi:hypothetical protein
MLLWDILIDHGRASQARSFLQRPFPFDSGSPR